METKEKIKTQIEHITGLRISIHDWKNVFVISNKDSHIGSLGKFREELLAKFPIVRFDGASFDIIKGK
jgi:hypothetical protein